MKARRKINRRTFYYLALFLPLFILAVFLVTFATLPQASETTSTFPLESVTGTLRSVNPNTPNDFILTTFRGGVQTEVFAFGVNQTITNQLKTFVGKGEVTLYGRFTPNDRRPRLVPAYIFVVESVTPPLTEQASCEDTRMDIAFAIDNEAGMALGVPSPASLAQKFISRAEGKLQKENDTSALITFPQPRQVSQEFTTDFSAVTQKAREIEFLRSVDDFRSGLLFASDYVPAGRRYEVTGPLPGAVILLTNSQASITSDMLAAVEEDYKQRALRYFIVSVGQNNPNFGELAAKGGGGAYLITSADQIEDTVNLLFSRINQPFAHCITIETQSNKKTLRPGRTLALTYTITNRTREDVTNGLLTQILPDIFATNDNRSLLNLPISVIKAGETLTRMIEVKRP